MGAKSCATTSLPSARKKSSSSAGRTPSVSACSAPLAFRRRSRPSAIRPEFLPGAHLPAYPCVGDGPTLPHRRSILPRKQSPRSEPGRFLEPALPAGRMGGGNPQAVSRGQISQCVGLRLQGHLRRRRVRNHNAFLSRNFWFFHIFQNFSRRRYGCCLVRDRRIPSYAFCLKILLLSYPACSRLSLNRSPDRRRESPKSSISCDVGGPAKERPPAALRQVIKRSDQASHSKPVKSLELMFDDNTLTRIGPETYFSFKAGTRDLTLQQGTLLLQVPKGLGGAKSAPPRSQRRSPAPP